MNEVPLSVHVAQDFLRFRPRPPLPLSLPRGGLLFPLGAFRFALAHCFLYPATHNRKPAYNKVAERRGDSQ